MYRNRPLPLIPRLIYRSLRALAWAGVRVFYRRRVVLGREHLRFDGPAIVIANHPSTLLDVLNPGVHIHQEMFFLANYGLFKHPVTNWLFRLLFCIPVKRKEDVAEGERRDNEAAFEASYQHLEQHGVLFIAPEGTSWMNRLAREFKTGAARIACGAEARGDWKLDVKVVPCGLTYSAPHLFRSDVVVQYGAPVYARDWADAWAADPQRAAEAMTVALQDRMQDLCIRVRDEAGDALLARVETLLHNSAPLPLAEEYARTKALMPRVLENAGLAEKTRSYFEDLHAADITDEGLVLAAEPAPRAWYEALLLLVGAPLGLLGLAAWFLPCFLPWLLNRQLKLYVGYSSTVKIVAGILTFPLAFWGMWRLGLALGGTPWHGLGALAGFVFLGFYTEQYFDLLRRFRARRAALGLAARSREEMLKRRQEIIQNL